MATSSKSSVYQGSNEVKDYICNACEDQNKVETSSDFYCKQCDRFYCGNCIDAHGKALAKHTVFGRAEIDKWPVSKKVVDFLQTCDFHKDHKIDNFCNLHRQLCCPQCLSDQHSECSQVTPISKLTYTQPTDLQGLSAKLETVLAQIKSLQINQEASVQSLQGAYKEHEGSTIKIMCQNIIATVDECGNSSVSTSDENEQYINVYTNNEEMCSIILSLLNEFDNSTVKELKEMKDEVTIIKDSITSAIHKCTFLQNDFTQLYEIIHKIGHNKELCLIASIKSEHIIQQALTVLGKSGKVFTVQEKSEHNVRRPSYSDTCFIIGCCVLPGGQVLVADWYNRKVKLLNQQYQVVSHWGVSAWPRDMCMITPSEVAVTVDDLGNIHEVQFITVTKGQLVPGRKFQLQHPCEGIAHHQGDLFITSGTALYKYTLSGKLVCRLHEDGSGDLTVYKCAVSPTGDRLYITNWHKDRLLTLARDGTVLATLIDPVLRDPSGLHVTPAGQVLVSGFGSHTVVQVDREGTRKLATLTTRDDGVFWPESVCYSSISSSIIVGQRDDMILVFRVE